MLKNRKSFKNEPDEKPDAMMVLLKNVICKSFSYLLYKSEMQ